MHKLEELAAAVTIQSTRTPAPAPADSWDAKASHWSCTLHYQGRTMAAVEYHQGSAHKKPPTAAGVLYALLFDAGSVEGQDFAGWCGELGYSQDSRRALSTYLECQDIAQRVRALLGRDFAEFAEAARGY